MYKLVIFTVLLAFVYAAPGHDHHAHKSTEIHHSVEVPHVEPVAKKHTDAIPSHSHDHSSEEHKTKESHVVSDHATPVKTVPVVPEVKTAPVVPVVSSTHKSVHDEHKSVHDEHKLVHDEHKSGHDEHKH